MTEAVVLLVSFICLIAVRVPIAFALLLSGSLFFFFEDRLVPWTITQRMFSGVDSFVILAVPLFILTANLMNEAQVTSRLIRLTMAIIGVVRGGLGMVNVATSMIFAGVSGSSTADTAAVGSVLIPQMSKRGYDKEFSVAVTASSSVIGTIIPPSIQMIFWGALTNTSIGAMFLGGMIPGILIGGGMLAVVYATAVRQDYPTEDRIAWSEVRDAFWDSLLALGVPVVVIGGIILGIVTATEAAVLSVIYALILGLFVYRSISLRDLPRIFRESANLSCLPLFALAAASVFSFLLAYYRIPRLLGGALEGVPLVLLLPAIVLIWLLIGTFLDALPAMVIMIPVLAPLVTSAGLDPVQYGVISVMALASGLITPPYGLCLLLSASIADIPMAQAIRGLWPFFLVIMSVIVLCMLFPPIVTWLPSLM